LGKFNDVIAGQLENIQYAGLPAAVNKFGKCTLESSAQEHANV